MSLQNYLKLHFFLFLFFVYKLLINIRNWGNTLNSRERKIHWIFFWCYISKQDTILWRISDEQPQIIIFIILIFSIYIYIYIFLPIFIATGVSYFTHLSCFWYNTLHWCCYIDESFIRLTSCVNNNSHWFFGIENFIWSIINIFGWLWRWSVDFLSNSYL